MKCNDQNHNMTKCLLEFLTFLTSKIDLLPFQFFSNVFFYDITFR